MQFKIALPQLKLGADHPLNGYLAIKVQDFAHPRDVLADEELDLSEKRTVLAAWASDASAVESKPEFRWLAGTPGPVALSHILSGLRALDRQAERQILPSFAAQQSRVSLAMR